MKRINIVLSWVLTIILGSIAAPIIYGLFIIFPFGEARALKIDDLFVFIFFSAAFSAICSAPTILILFLQNEYIRRLPSSNEKRWIIAKKTQLICSIITFSILIFEAWMDGLLYILICSLVYTLIGISLWKRLVYNDRITSK